MKVPAGSIVTINGFKGVLSDDIQLSLRTEYRDAMPEIRNSVTEFVDTLAGVTNQIFGHGFSSQFKQQTTRLWAKTDPATISMNVSFDRIGVDGCFRSGETLYNTIKDFCKIPLPIERVGGNLTPPGPSLLQGIGISALDSLSIRESSINSELNNIAARSRFVTVEVGSLTFTRLIMESADPKFSKVQDESGFPINYEVAFKFTTLWAATDRMVDSWRSTRWDTF